MKMNEEEMTVGDGMEILIVEDSPTQAEQLRHLLEEHDFQVRVAGNGKEALHLLRQKTPTIVISDILMPEMDGYQLCAEIRRNEQLRSVPVILLTSLTDPLDVIKGLECGADNFITKPYGERYLLSRIQYLLVTQELRKHERTKMGVEILFAGKRYLITSERQQILDLLLSIYEAAVQKNHELREVQEKLETMNDRLAELVHERTASLQLEVTQRRQAEEALREANLRLEGALESLKKTQQRMVQQERLRAFGQMASGIAHDFNNALSPILGYSEMLLASLKAAFNPEEAREYLELIHTSARDAANVVRQMREFYRPRDESEQVQLLNLNEIVRQAVSLTEPRWKAQAQAGGITLQVKTELGRIPRILCDESELREVLVNLIFNALDAMPEGGTLTIQTRRENDSVILEVADTGGGMTEEAIQHCFEPFYSTKGERGTGLGLAMVYGIIQRHRGAIMVDSSPGKGTRFAIQLPGRVSDSEGEAQKPPQSLLPSLRVLVVDDEPLVGKVIADYLKSEGHRPESASNGAEALQKFKRGGFDVVVTDNAMPEMNGVQLCLAVKQVSPETPVILLTGFGDLLNHQEKPESVDLVVSKPVTLSALREALLKVSKDLQSYNQS